MKLEHFLLYERSLVKIKLIHISTITFETFLNKGECENVTETKTNKKYLGMMACE